MGVSIKYYDLKILGKIKNWVKFIFCNWNLNDNGLGAQTTLSGREFQIFTTRQEKKNLLVLFLATRSERR